MYAVIEQSGHQYKVIPGAEFDVDNLSFEEGKVFTNDKVLLLVDGDNIRIGKPYLRDIKVELKVVKNYKGEKIHILRFRAKSRYTKRKGFRPKLSRVKVESIKS